MSPRSKREYLLAVRLRYAQASRRAKGQILDEVCATLRCHRKSAIRVLTGPPPRQTSRQRKRGPTYGERTIGVLKTIWEAAGYPWSVRLKALLPLWLPWAKQHWTIPPALEHQMVTISPRTIDRRLHPFKQQLRARQYGRTKPGTLLKHHIPIQAGRWDVTTPGFGEIDLVAHCGPALDGEHCWSLNFTDLATTWVETWAVLGRHQRGVHQAIDDIAHALPFALRGLDSDNDVAFINDLYRHEWRLMMNLFQPSVKLLRKVRVGSRLKRVYDVPQTPLDRLIASGQGDPGKVQTFQQLRGQLDPFALAEVIERKLTAIYRLASRPPRSRLTRPEQEALQEVSHLLGIPILDGGAPARLKQRSPSVTPTMARR